MKISLFHLVFFWVCTLHFASGQVRFHKTRSSDPASSVSITDSAQRSITLLPGFVWKADTTRTYRTVLTGILPVTPGTITIEWPKNGQITQRNNSNQGWIHVKGTYSDPFLESIKIEATPVQGGTYATKTIPVSGGNFEAAILVVGGDYNIKVSENVSDGYPKVPAGNTTATRVGVGEVFMIWGHSFAEGGHPDDYNEPRINRASTDERSRTVPAIMFNPAYDNEYFHNIPGLPFEYHKIVDNVGPMVNNSWMWGAFADSLVKRFNVPVLMYSAAFGGSGVFMHQHNINNEWFPWFPNFAENRFPHRGITATMTHYVPRSGIRGVLVHHGINDQNHFWPFESNFLNTVHHIRNNEAFSPGLSFVLSRDVAQADVNMQLDNMISNQANFYPGIDLRQGYTNGNWRKDEYGCGGCGHYKNTLTALTKYLELWVAAFPNSLVNSGTFKEANVPSGLKF